MHFLSKFILLFITLTILSFNLISCQILYPKNLKFLQENSSSSNPTLQIEFSFTCGNSFMISKKIANDLVNEIRKKGVTKFELEILSHNYKDSDIKDKNFNINLIRKENENNLKSLLATSNLTSEKFNKILSKYPHKLLMNNRDELIIDEVDLKMREELVNKLVNLIRN